MKTIQDEVFDGIRKTINRFREKPFHYFTEADIHSSLLNDMMSGASDILTRRPETTKHISVSLVHQEYPTNFRYSKSDLIHRVDLSTTALDNQKGDRGNFDLAVLNPEFVERTLSHNTLYDALKHIINKDNRLVIERRDNSPEEFRKEIMFAIEVKFIHPFNARNKHMLYEVIRDDNKLQLAYETSGGFVCPVNLVFCSTAGLERSDDKESVVTLVKNYIEKGEVKDYDDTSFSRPENVVGIFIESFVDPGSDVSKKTTVKPVLSRGKGEWTEDLRMKLNF